ncbi:unnamed protein product [Dovyalis caffra]|uniref:Uncharacterized protein n=1 Tax=Dovyalis caffra TaxID=77055 RepID=A0AAV1QXI2_9ROSI|nr:unnamed protein product [Dovyalis caffra]
MSQRSQDTSILCYSNWQGRSTTNMELGTQPGHLFSRLGRLWISANIYVTLVPDIEVFTDTVNDMVSLVLATTQAHMTDTACKKVYPIDFTGEFKGQD